MKTFLVWAEENKLELPQVDESQRRAGIGPQYPSGYALRDLYPPQHWTRTAADAPWKLQTAKNTKDKAPSDDAP